MKLDLKELINKLVKAPTQIYIAPSQWSFESGHGSGTIGGDGIRITIFNNGQMVAFGGQLNASSFVGGSSGTPYMRTAKPNELPANKSWPPVGVQRSGQAGGSTLSSSAWAFRDRIWATTDANYLYLRSANYLGSQASGFMEFQLYGAVYPLEIT